MIPRRYAPILFSLILSGVMSFLVSGIATIRASGLSMGVVDVWAGSWLAAWIAAFLAVVMVTPIARKLVQFLSRED